MIIPDEFQKRGQFFPAFLVHVTDRGTAYLTNPRGEKVSKDNILWLVHALENEIVYVDTESKLNRENK